MKITIDEALERLEANHGNPWELLAPILRQIIRDQGQNGLNKVIDYGHPKESEPNDE